MTPDPVPPPSSWSSSPEPGSPAWASAPWSWYFVPRPVYTGGNRVELLRGGAELFPAMVAAIDAARREVWLATYICEPEGAVLPVLAALERAAQRGVRVRVVLDGFGSLRHLAALQRRLQASGVSLAVFRSLQHWTHWLQPGQLRRLHMKLCSVDAEQGFVGGINLLDDRLDLRHGHTELPRLDYAVAVHGPVVHALQHAVRAMWSRARFGRDWRIEVQALARERHPLLHIRALWGRLRLMRRKGAPESVLQPLPVRAAFVVRDNVRQRRTIERAYIQAIRQARERVWLISPYFYPGREFRRVLCQAAARGVDVHLLLQGKPDYRLAAMAAHVLYDELMHHGVHIHEYTPAFLHAKVAVVDAEWATVGSSNIDPISLLLNLEANLMVRDADFCGLLAEQIMQALADSHEVSARDVRLHGWAAWLRRGIVAWCAHVYLRLAGVTGRY